MAKIVLNSTPQLISDGTKKVYLTSRAEYFKIIQSQSAPDKTSWHLEQKFFADSGKWWAWSENGEIAADKSEW
jgi:hypothetical protein